MKQKRTFLLLTLVVGVLFLGVVYASINSITLNINGTVTATPDQANFNVYFTGTPTSSGDGSATITLATGTYPTTATMNVSGLSTAGDTLTAKFTVKNGSDDLFANLSSNVETNSNPTYFNVTTSFDTSTLSPSNTTILTVTVKLIKTPISSQSSSISVKLTASPAYS